MSSSVENKLDYVDAKVVRALFACPLPLTKIVHKSGVTTAKVHHSLSVLLEKGIVDCSFEDDKCFYAVNSEKIPIAMNEKSEVTEKLGSYVVKLRGLPWSATEQDIRQFFDNSPEVVEVQLTYNREGRMSGEAYVKLMSKFVYNAVLAKNRRMMGKRYIEVFPSKKSGMDLACKTGGAECADNLNMCNIASESMVRLRGLPFEVTKSEIIEFFGDMKIAEEKISLPVNYAGKPTGDAFVSLQTKDEMNVAVCKHKNFMNNRYIEVFPSSAQEETQMSTRAQLPPKSKYYRGRGNWGNAGTTYSNATYGSPYGGYVNKTGGLRDQRYEMGSEYIDFASD